MGNRPLWSAPLLLLAGCLVDLPARDAENAYRCNDSEQCLDGYACVDGFCARDRGDQTGCDNGCTNPPDCNDCLPPPDICWEMCTEHDDCIAGWRCSDNECVPCTIDEHCWALLTGWTANCSRDLDCASGRCVDVEGQSYCASEPPCTSPEEIRSYPLVETPTTTVDVCAITSHTCVDDTCVLTCSSGKDCPAAYHPTCNTTTHTCVCSSNDDCLAAGSPGSRCYQGQCLCSSDLECAGTLTQCTADGCTCRDNSECTLSSNGDLCLGYSPQCACATVADCSGIRKHPGTTWRCQ